MTTILIQQKRDITSVTPVLIQQKRRPTAQSRPSCRLLGLSRDKLCPLGLSRLFSLTLHSTGRSSTVLSELNRYANQRSVSRLEINEYQHRLCYKTICYYFRCFGCSAACVVGRLLESMFVSRVMDTPHRTMFWNSFSFDFCKRCYDLSVHVHYLLFVRVNKKTRQVDASDSRVKIIISSEKFKRGWTLTTSQCTITCIIVYVKTERTVIENTKVT